MISKDHALTYLTVKFRVKISVQNMFHPDWEILYENADGLDLVNSVFYSKSFANFSAISATSESKFLTMFSPETKID